MAEAVSLLLGLTEGEYKGRVLVILAGYEGPVRAALAKNQGLSRRFLKKAVVIPRWTAEQCVTDFFLRAGRARMVSEDKPDPGAPLQDVPAGPVTDAVRSAVASMMAHTHFGNSGTVETFVSHVNMQRSARANAEEEAAERAARAAGGGAAGATPASFLPKRAGQAAPAPYTVADVQRALATVTAALTGVESKSTRAAPVAGPFAGGGGGGGGGGYNITSIPPPPAAAPPRVAPPPAAPKLTQVVEEEDFYADPPPAAAGGGGGGGGGAVSLEGLLAQLGYDADRCVDICESKAYPPELLAAAAAQCGDPARPHEALKRELDPQADAILSPGAKGPGLREAVRQQRLELAKLDAAIAGAVTEEEKKAAAEKKREARRMRLKWCTVCLRPDCNFRPMCVRAGRAPPLALPTAGTQP